MGAWTNERKDEERSTKPNAMGLEVAESFGFGRACKFVDTLVTGHTFHRRSGRTQTLTCFARRGFYWTWTGLPGVPMIHRRISEETRFWMAIPCVERQNADTTNHLAVTGLHAA